MSLALLITPEIMTVIKEVALRLDETIIYSRASASIDFEQELDELSRIPVAKLIIALSCCDGLADEAKLIKLLRSYRIKRENTRIILITEKRIQGDTTLSAAVKLGIWDIVNVFPETNDFSEMIEKAITMPGGYAKAVKWDMDNEPIVPQKDEQAAVVKERYIEVETEKIIGKPVIAIAGVSKRIGVTHTCISIATYLRTLKFNTVILETQESPVFKAIKNSYSDVIESKDTFQLGGVHYIPYKAQHDIVNALETYDYIILDMGLLNSLTDTYKHEFLRASVRIVVSGTKPWEEKAFIYHIKSFEFVNKCKYLFSFSDEEGIANVRKSFKPLNAYKAEYIPNPFTSTKQGSTLYERILADILPVARVKKNKYLVLYDLLKEIIIKTQIFAKELIGR